MRKLLCAIVIFGLGSVGALADDGYATGDASVAQVTVTIPSPVFGGDVVNMSVSYPLVSPTNVRCILVLPTNDPVYEAEIKVYLRRANLESSGASCPFFIPDFFQIEGIGYAIAVVDGHGTGIARFEVLP